MMVKSVLPITVEFLVNRNVRFNSKGLLKTVPYFIFFPIFIAVLTVTALADEAGGTVEESVDIETSYGVEEDTGIVDEADDVSVDEAGVTEETGELDTDETETGVPGDYDESSEAETGTEEYVETGEGEGETGEFVETEGEEGEPGEYVETTEEEEEYVHRPRPISPPFIVYDFDFYREHKADYSYTSYGHFFGGGVNILEKYDFTFGFGVKGDSRDRLRKLVRFMFQSPMWKDAYGTAGMEYQFELDYNPNIMWIFGLYQEYGEDWTFDFYDELATYWNQDNFSNAFNFNMSYLMWYQARVNLHIGMDSFYIKRYNDYFRRIEWEPGQEGLGLMRFRGGVSKKLYEDSYGYWALKGELAYDTDNVFAGIATTDYYYKLGSRLVFAFNASFSFDSLGYDVEGLFAEFIMRPF
jgi:hypothetical protein